MHHQGRFRDVSSRCQETVRPIDDVIFGAADPDDPRHASLDLELGSVRRLKQRVHILVLVRTLVRVFLLVSIHVRDNPSPLHRPQPLPASAAVLPCSNRDRRRFSRCRGDACNPCAVPLQPLPLPPLRYRSHRCAAAAVADAAATCRRLTANHTAACAAAATAAALKHRCAAAATKAAAVLSLPLLSAVAAAAADTAALSCAATNANCCRCHCHRCRRRHRCAATAAASSAQRLSCATTALLPPATPTPLCCRCHCHRSTAALPPLS